MRFSKSIQFLVFVYRDRVYVCSLRHVSVLINGQRGIIFSLPVRGQVSSELMGFNFCFLGYKDKSQYGGFSCFRDGLKSAKSILC